MFSEVSFVLALFMLLIFERVVNALSSSLYSFVGGVDDGPDALKGYASMQLLGSYVSFLASLGSSAASLFLGAVGSVMSFVVWAFAVSIFFSFLYVLVEYYPEVFVELVSYWNDPLGPVLYSVVMAPLEVFNTLLIPVLGLYNMVVWIVAQLWANLVLVEVFKDFELFRAIALGTANFVRHFTLGFVDYVMILIQTCPASDGDRCYEAGRRVFDVITPMNDLKDVSRSLVQVGENMCSVMNGPLQIVGYFFLDINFAKGVHNILNSILFTVVQVPIVTMLRCARNPDNVIMCLPDFEPSFNMMTSGLRSIGMGLDNWINVGSIIVQNSLGIGGAPTCDLLAPGFTAANYSRDLFANRGAPIVVGLTDALYAVTNGVHAQYFSSYKSTETVTAANIWPIEIDTRHGVAAVVYHKFATDRDELGNPTTTMLGCQCLDSAGQPPVKIMCGLALKELASYGPNLDPAELTFEVSFQDTRTANHLTCAQMEISVQSVRWPVTRFTGSYQSRDTLDATCQSKGTCSRVDATIWVSPLCSSGTTEVQLQCVSIFTGASCFPYCMAARPSGSGADALILYNAKDWSGKVHVVDRDCGVARHLSNPTECVDAGTCSYVQNSYLESDPGSVLTTVRGDIGNGAVLIRKWDRTAGCVQSDSSVSIISSELHLSYGATADRTYRALLLPTQPFSFAGDVTLTSYRDPTGKYFVKIDRLYGNEVNEFTMVNVQKAFPAQAPADVPRNVASEPVDLLPIPYALSSFSGKRHPSVSTQTSVFFTVNPSLDMFRGFASGCYELNFRNWKTQLSALSSYAPIRIWRVDPYAYCPVGDDGTSRCGAGNVGFVDIPGSFLEIAADSIFDITQCEAVFAMEVTALEYLNVENIAVTILMASFEDYSLETGVLRTDSTRSYYRIMYLSTFTMALSDEPFNRDFNLAELSQGQLCAGMRRFPNLGSMSAEVICAWVNLLRPVISLIVNIPGMIEIWGDGRPCALNTHGHSLLRQCGSEMLSLDDFFDAVNRANAHYWSAFNLVAASIRGTGQSRLANVVDGVAYYGAGTSSPMGPLSSVITSVRIPIAGVAGAITSTVFPSMPTASSSALMLSSNPVRMAQFSYQLVTGCIVDIIPLALRVDRYGDQEAGRELVALFINRLFQARDGYYQSVTQGILQGCSGLSLMIGFDNPWAVLIRRQCEAVPLSLVGIYDLVLAIAGEVPVAKCLCVDAMVGGDFRSNAMDKCYYLVPAHLQSFVLGLIEVSTLDPGSIEAVCKTFVQHAGDSVSKSMNPWFSKQLQASEAIASSFDYLLAVFDVTAGRCMDFESPFVSVLIPEPYDYFAACGSTSLCDLKCAVEMTAFDEALLKFQQSSQSRVVQSLTQSLFFNDRDEDTDMPMKIITLVELLVCDSICGGTSGTDTCIAIAGISANNTIAVKKYCVPKGIGLSVRSAPLEAWNVWESETWTDGALDIQFSDTISGDTLVVLRDGIGSSGQQPQEQFVTVHPRSIQQDAVVWDQFYSTEFDRLRRLLFCRVNMFVSNQPVRTDGTSVVTLAIDRIFVFPQRSAGDHAYIVVSTVDDLGRDVGIDTNHHGAMCGMFSASVIAARGSSPFADMRRCGSMVEFFQLGRSGYVPIVLNQYDPVYTHVAQVPTATGLPLKLMKFQLSAAEVFYFADGTVSVLADDSGIQSPFPTYQQFSSFGRDSIRTMRKLVPDHVRMTTAGVAVHVSPRMAQNTLTFFDLQGTGLNKLEYYMSADPNTLMYWLTRVSVVVNDGGFSASSSASEMVGVNLTIYETCDRRSCMGCVNERLMSLCYAMQQCTVVNCIGTIVNQAKPLCNLGLAMQSHTNALISLALGGWLAFVETYSTMLKLTLAGAQSVELTYIDDAFFGFICSAKDMGGQVTGLLTSAIGAGLLSGSRRPAPDNVGGGVIDTRATARNTIILNGVNSLLYQMSLYPLYMMLIARKITSCTTKDLLAVISAGGFSITIGKPGFDQAMDLVAGSCMTSFMEESVVSGSSHDGVADSVFAAYGDLAAGLLIGNEKQVKTAATAKKLNRLGSRAQLGPLLHVIDGHLSFASGVVSGLQDMAQTIDETNCKLPDYSMHKVLTCACGDKAVAIRSAQARSSIYAHWCTGTLKLLDGFGRVTYVDNKITYHSLVAAMPTISQYLQCISRLTSGTSSSDCAAYKPHVPFLDDGNQLDIVSIAVLARCRANYQQQVWDEGAFRRYELEYTMGSVRVVGSLGDCLVTAHENSLSNAGCLQDYLNSVGLSKASYFGYETSSAVDSVDACIVFTGPASHASLLIREKFQPCVTSVQYEKTTESCGRIDNIFGTPSRCQLAPMIWSGGSKNKVPVAVLHQIAEPLLADKHVLALRYFKEAKLQALCALNALGNYVNNNLDVVLFSGEGDGLHQMFDCMVQGPYAKMDLWSRGVSRDLAVPSWARDVGGAGISRQLDLPCGGATLGGDIKPPFTCGGSTRRAVIKYFVRDHINKNAAGVSLVVQLIREQIAKLVAAWDKDPAEYACVVNGTSSLENCRATEPENFVPPGLQVAFDAISSSDVIKEITKKIWPYLQEAFVGANKNDEFFKYHLDSVEQGTWDWHASGVDAIARDDGLYGSQHPITNYGAAETGAPFEHDSSIWDMCAGMVSQVIFTMPVVSLTVDGHDSWTTATVLGLRNRQLEFDPVREPDFDGVDPNGLSMLEKYVRLLLERSFTDSPLFWHYAVRHVPSESLVCDSSLPSTHNITPGTLKFSREGGVDVFPDINDLPGYGYDAFPLGGTDAQCFCGWDLNNGRCLVPDAVCLSTNQSIGCSYLHGSQELRKFTTGLVESWNTTGSWGCPETDLSDSWGIMPSESAAMSWIAVETGDDFEINTLDLLKTGMGGLRIGNANLLAHQARVQGVNPGSRVDKLHSLAGNSSVVLKNCGDNILKTFDAQRVVDDVVDDLFPMAQGILDSHVVSVCLRFAIEYLRLRVMDMIAENGLKDMRSYMDTQEPVVARWRTKCELQLDMLGICKSNGLFDYVPVVEHPYDCPFRITDDYTDREYYVTPGCLVWIRDSPTIGSFYDPCRNNGCATSGMTFTVGVIRLMGRIPFDVRETGSGEALGTWPGVFLSSDDAVNQEHTELASLIAQWHQTGRGGVLPWRLQQTFVEKVVSGGGTNVKGGIGNTLPQHSWGTAEGFGNTSMEFCDAISDWWPEDWSKPTGYHVTLPCDGADAAYRTFDSAFFMETGADSNGTFTVAMRYTHQMLRNITTATNEYGRSGFCRRGAYGMPTHVTNTMRVCTQDAIGIKYDAHVPVKPLWDSNEYGSEYCSPSPYDVPWNIDSGARGNTPPGMFSVGHLPHYYGEDFASITSNFFPISSLVKEYVHPGVQEHSWGSSCTHGDFLECENDNDCVSTGSVALECLRGVCVLAYSQDDGEMVCYRHADCEDYNKMCSGEGICEEAVWQVENRLDATDHGGNAIEFDMFAESCGSIENNVESYDMWGASKWETIPDILPMYGMCSYRGWFEYREFLTPSQSSLLKFPRVSTGCVANDCTSGDFRGDRRTWWDTASDHGDVDFPPIRETGKYTVLPHVCDRDYEHLENMRGCTPIDAVVLSYESGVSNGRNFQELRSTHAQTFDRSNRISFLKPDALYFANKRTGFLSVEIPPQVTRSSDTSPDRTFQKCGSIPQCVRLPFHFNGGVTSRVVNDMVQLRPWDFDKDSEMCGSFGVFLGVNHPRCAGLGNNVNCCMIDKGVAVHYRVACDSTLAKLLWVANGDNILTGVELICESLHYGRGGFYTTPTTSADARDFLLMSKSLQLNELWDILSQAGVHVSTSSAAYVLKTTFGEVFAGLLQNTATCAGSQTAPWCTLYHQNSRMLGGYYFGRYGLQEFPLAWWHKCMLLSSRKFSTALSLQDTITCTAWGVPDSTPQYGSPPVALLAKLNGGITTQTLQESSNLFITKLLTRVENYRPGAVKPSCVKENVYSFKSLEVSRQLECTSRILQYTYTNGGNGFMFGTIPDYCSTRNDASRSVDEDFTSNLLDTVKTWVMNDLRIQKSTQLHDFISQSESNINEKGFLTHRYNPQPFASASLSFTSLVDRISNGVLETVQSPPAVCTIDALEIQATQGGRDLLQCAAVEFGLQASQCELVYDALLIISTALERASTESNGTPVTSSLLQSTKTAGIRYSFDEAAVEIQLKTNLEACRASVLANQFICDASVYSSPCHMRSETPPTKQELAKLIMTQNDHPAFRVLGGLFDPANLPILPLIDVDLNTIVGNEDGVMEKLGGNTWWSRERDIIACVNDNFCDNIAETAKSREKLGGTHRPYKFMLNIVRNAWTLHGGSGPAIGRNSGMYTHNEVTKSTITTTDATADAALRKMITRVDTSVYVRAPAYWDYGFRRSQTFQAGDYAAASGNSDIENESGEFEPRMLDFPAPIIDFTNVDFMQSFGHEAWKFAKLGEVDPTRGCMPARVSLEKGDDVVRDQIRPDNCFRVKVGSGCWDSTWMVNDLLMYTGDNTLQRDLEVRNKTQLVRGNSHLAFEWNVAQDPLKIVSENTANSRQVAYTMYLALLQYILTMDYALYFTVPKPLNVYTNHGGWYGNYRGFDANALLSHDEDVEALKEKQVCGANATEFQYGISRNSGVYSDAESHYRATVRKNGGSVIYPDEVLVWKGLSYQHSISHTLPTWSMNTRDVRQVFGTWVLDSQQRSTRGSARNSVCYYDGSKRDVINPWVGGDFNPYDMCDTITSGVATTDTSIVNEERSVGCNERICTMNDGGVSDFYQSQPNSECFTNGNRIPTFPNVPKQVSRYHNVEDGSEICLPVEVCTSRLSGCKPVEVFDTNMCEHPPVLPKTCNHPQGMLNGLSGGPVEDTLYADYTAVYDREFLTDTSAGGAGLFRNGGNRMYREKTILAKNALNHGILKQSSQDIAGHHVVFVVAPGDTVGTPRMYVERTPLSYPRSIAAIVGKGSFFAPTTLGNAELLAMSKQSSATSGWLQDLDASMRGEQSLADRLYPQLHQSVSHKWSCPLRRIAFWTRVVDDEYFSPLIPSPPRASRLFGYANPDGIRSHPTMSYASGKNRVGNMYTSNGFCTCTIADSCKTLNSTTLCGVVDTIKSLYDQNLRDLLIVQQVRTSCQAQLDWPYEAGTLRDGTVVHARDTSGRYIDSQSSCDVMDRLPPFRYVYRPNGNITSPLTTSLHKGGACHMGTAPMFTTIPSKTTSAAPGLTYTYATGSCTKIEETHTNITVSCDYDKGVTAPDIVVMQKTLAKAPQWAVDRMKIQRQRCDTCPKPPTWTDFRGNELPSGPEVSYGIPFRWSSSRLLAADVKLWLCGSHHNDSSTCNMLLNETAWGLESFLDYFTNDAAALFSGNQTSALPTLQEAVNRSDAYSDTRLWNGPDAAWVACSQQPGGKCFGGIAKEDWYSSRRGDVCVAEFTRQVAAGTVNESTLPFDICTLSADLNDMCIKLKTATELVKSGNCIAAQGSECVQTEWVYTPSMYSTSNQNFVRATVVDFYETFGAPNTASFTAGNPDNVGLLVCPLDEEDSAIKIRNDQMTGMCASKQLERLKDAIKIVRRIVHIVVEAGYIQLQIVFTLFRLIIPGLGSKDETIKELEFWFKRYLRLIFESVVAMVNLFFRMIFDTGGFGETMKALLNLICAFISIVMDAYNQTLCVWLKSVIAPCIKLLIDAVTPILEFFNVNNGLVSMLSGIVDSIIGSDCAYSMPCSGIEVFQVKEPTVKTPKP
jgi:hypothetical protein